MPYFLSVIWLQDRTNKPKLSGNFFHVRTSGSFTDSDYNCIGNFNYSCTHFIDCNCDCMLMENGGKKQHSLSVWELNIGKLTILPVPNINCLAWEYDANCAALTTMARATVGPQPWNITLQFLQK